MTADVRLPGVLDSVPPGMTEGIVINEYGMPERGLERLYLFEEGTGTALADELGGSAGVLDSIASSNNSSSWLTNGGIEIGGAALASFPTYEFNSEWTILSASRIVNHTGSAGTNKVVGLLGLRNMGVSPARGALLYESGATDLSQSQSTAGYVQRASNGSGAYGTPSTLTPSPMDVYNKPRLCMLSYDGSSTLTSLIVDKDGNTIASGSVGTNDAEMFTVSSVTLSVIQWCLGGVSSSFAGGITQHERAALYSRPLSDFSVVEITQIAAALAELGDERGRPW